jgi:copper resistance protein C
LRRAQELKMSIRTLALSLAVAALWATTASAHAHLVVASPSPDAAVAAPVTIQATFSETLEAKFSILTLAKTGAPGPIKVAAASTVAADHKTLVARPKSPLAAGAYAVHWQAVSADGHKMVGDYSFTVK